MTASTKQIATTRHRNGPTGLASIRASTSIRRGLEAVGDVQRLPYGTALLMAPPRQKHQLLAAAHQPQLIWGKQKEGHQSGER